MSEPSGCARWEVELVTDPVSDPDSTRVLSTLPGWQGFGRSRVDGIPAGSRSRFALTAEDLERGGLEQRVDILARYGIYVSRVIGEHPAVRRVNQRLGYL